MNQSHCKAMFQMITLFSLLAMLFGMVPAAPAQAATVTVTDCSAPGGAAGRLVDVIAAASPGDTINFSCSGTLTLTASITITKNLTIDGSGQAVTISGGGTVQVFYINSGVTATLNRLTIANGYVAGWGGGIRNDGNLTVMNSTLSGNSATGGGGYGGGINNFGNLTVANSTFSGNSADNGGGGIQSASYLTVTNSTFWNNSANGDGGGIRSSGYAVTVTNSTFSGNAAAGSGGGLYNTWGTLSLANTIVANSTGSGDCYNDGPIVTNLNNLVEDGSCSAALSGDPNLGSLANNGGSTQTFALLGGSPAIDAGDDTVCSAAPVNGLDQRGSSRWQGAHCDIGAYEKSPTVVGDCSGPGGYPDRLVEVITAAPAGDTVTFTCSGTIVLDATIVLNKNLTIDGSGQAVTISGGGTVQVFYINSGVTATLNRLTIANGYVAGWGGGIRNDGNLTVMNSTLSGNSATGGGGYGGGINNFGNLTVANSTFSGNSADNGGGGIQSASYLTVTNSTFWNNSASGNGGGIRSSGYAITVTNSTFSGNAAGGSGDGLHNTWGTLSLANTIVANSTGSGDCYNDGPIVTNLNNLVEDGSCSIGGVNFHTGDPNLGLLADNGGSAQTLALLTGSSAIDAGDDTTCSTAPVSGLDQRGTPRPVGAHCDIGAFEKVSSIVTNTNDSGPGSLRYALDYAMADDTITFAPGLSNGVITLTSALTPTRNVTLDGSALAAQISISGDANHNSTADTGDVRVFFINSNATITIDSLKIIHGFSEFDSGGGIYLFGGNLTLRNSTVSGSSASSGGGISNQGGNLTVENSTLSGNSALAYAGGGILNTYGLTPATLTVQNSTLSENTATSGVGGAIFNDNSSTLSIVNSTLSGNVALNGGAIANQDSNAVMIRNSTLSGNTATSGGGIYNASAYAPGWWTTFGFANTIIANSTSGGDCYNTGTIGTNTNNLVEDGSCSAALSGDPNLGPLANNGGSTQTFALLASSPAINTGDNSICAAAPVNNLDQRGVTRPQGAHCDIGAFERVNIAPAVTINQAIGQADPTTTSLISFTATFTEPINVATFTNDDITLGGTAGATTAVISQTAPNDGTTFNIAVSGMTGSGTVTATLTAAKVKDLAGNDNTASTSTDNTVTYRVVCTAISSGSWSVAFAACSPEDRFVIPIGMTVTLTSDIAFSGDLIIQGTLDPNGKTVTLNGSGNQAISGNPLNFYNLVLNKTNKTDTVTVSGKLKVVKKLTITKGKLISASDYGDVEIGIEGTLELTDDITVGGAWINDGALIANTAQVAFDGVEPQAIGGTQPTLFYRLVISPTARVFITTTPGVTDTVSNYGTLSQTLTLSGSGTPVAFLQISTDKYQGVVISTTDNLGQVSVAVQGNAAQCTGNALDLYRQRCFRVDVELSDTYTADMTFYTTAAEDSISGDTVYQYYPLVSSWADVGTAPCNTTPGEPCRAGNVTVATGSNYFLIGGGDSPTAVTLRDFTATTGPSLYISSTLAAFAALSMLAAARRMKGHWRP